MSLRLRSIQLLLCLLVIGARCAASEAAEPDLIAHWPLRADARDVGPNQLPTTNQGVAFEKRPFDQQTIQAAAFNGRGAHLQVDSSKFPQLGKNNFTIAAWVEIKADTDDDQGDLISQFDRASRNGFQLSCRTNTGVTTCQANTRQLQFGIDAGSEPRWRDEGRPGDALIAFALATHDGAPYAGTCEPQTGAAGHVYRYSPERQRNRWLDLGTPDKCNAISAMAEYDGHLYVGSARYRLGGSALPESENPHDGGKIFRLEDGDRWVEVGRLRGDQVAIGGLVVFRGKLYASSLYRPAGFYRFERDGEWTAIATPDDLRVEALSVFNGYLWASSYDGGYVFRYDGQQWKSYGPIGDNTQTYSFAIERGQLCVGTWPSGKVYRLAADDTWHDIGRLGDEKEVMGMLIHNGQFLAGTLPLAEVYRYDDAQAWTKIGQLDLTPDVTYRRAWTMASAAGRLFVSTLPSGKVFSVEVGRAVTYDRALRAGWHHVVAIRDGDRLRLLVDGRQVAESAPFEPGAFELSQAGTLLIGAGSGDFFHGSLRDVRIYSRALSAEEAGSLNRPE